MLADSALIAFLATAHPDQAREFYSEVLGLPLREESPFALVFDARGTMLRIQKLDRLTNVGYTVLGWLVDHLHEAVELLAQRGIRFERYPGLLQEKQGIWTTPDGNNIAWFTDPDGNTLSLIEFRQDKMRSRHGLRPQFQVSRDRNAHIFAGQEKTLGADSLAPGTHGCCMPNLSHLAAHAEVSMCETGREDVDFLPFSFVVKEE